MKNSYHQLVRILLVAFSLVSFQTFAQVSGTVFKDFNANGTKDASASYNEVGIAGVTVSATNPAGTALTVTYTGGGTSTNSTGGYSVTGGTLGQIRLVFTIPSYTYASKGAAGGTTVMFPTTATQNLAVNSPDDYWDSSTNPKYTISCFVNGLTTGNGSGDAGIVSTPYSSTGLNSAYQTYGGVQGTGPMPRVDATFGQVGTVWGEAYYKTQKHYYFATFLKRHCGMADGPGYVYNFDYSTATPSFAGKFNLQGVTPANGGAAIDLGSVNRTTGNSDYELSTDKSLPNTDLDAYGKVGKIAFGDADIQENTNYLWLVNLNQRALIRVDVSGNPISAPPAGGVNQYILSSLSGYPTSSTGVLRPWALKFAFGKGYLGVIDDASISGLSTDLKAYVLEFDPNNMAAGFTQKMVINDLNYKRTPQGSWLLFESWSDNYNDVANGGSQMYRAQPILSDIEFDENDNIYVSFLDRLGHQLGYWNNEPISGGGTLVRPATYGEILKGCKITTGWEIEGTGSCHTGTTEFIQDWSGDNEVESSQGAVSLLKGRNQLLQVSIDPHPQGAQSGSIDTYWTTQGVNTYNLSNGQIDNWYSVYQSSTVESFGKANGLGDIELQVDAAPIEIGNRVWIDTDKDGVQDAGELGVSGVTVTLCLASAPSTPVATATTDANGNYYFSNATGTSTASVIYGVNLQFSTNYILKFPLTTGGKSLTTANLGGNDLLDSDANASGQVAFTTGLSGQNIHTYDVGYVSCVPPVASGTAPKTQTICQGGTATAYTASPATGVQYNWYGPLADTTSAAFGTSLATTQTYTPTGTALTTVGTKYYAVIVNNTGDATCADTAFVKLVVNANPTLTGGSVCVGKTITLTGSGTPAASNPYVSSNTAVATITSGGVVTGVSAGTSTITYTDASGCTATATVTVTANPSLTGGSVCVGKTITLTGSGTPAASNPYVSSNTAVATITSGGVVTGVSAGTSTITYTDASGCTATATVTVTANPTLTGGSVCVGKTITLTGSGTPAASNPYVSSNTAVATITSGGVVTGVSAGTSTITYTDASGCTATATVTVTANPTLTLVSAVCSSDLTTYTITFTSNGTVSSTAGTVDNAAKTVSGIPTGTNVTLTATLSSCTTTLAVTAPNCNCPTVNPPVSGGDKSICQGQTIPALTVTVGTGESANWYDAANTLLASNTLSYTPTAAGSYYAEAYNTTTNCKSATKTLVRLIINANPTLTGGSVCVGKTITLTGSGTPAASNPYVSSNTAVATVTSGGVVTGVSAGTSTITYTDASGCTATATVTVTANPTLTLVSAVCSSDLTTYTITFTSNGTVSSTTGTVDNAAKTVSGIPTGTNVTLTATLSSCTTTLAVTAPNCNCPTVAAPAVANASHCGTGTVVANITTACVTGTTMKIYSDVTLTTDVTNSFTIGASTVTSPSISSTTTYYAACVDNTSTTCKSTGDSFILTITTIPTATAAATQPACTGTNAPNNGGITITGFTTGQRYQYSAGATFSSGSAIPTSITVIPTGGVITSTLTNTTGSYTVRIYDATDNTCFVDRTISITAVACCTPPTAKGYGLPASCTNGLSNIDAQIILYEVTNATKYGYSQGVTYTGPAYTSATAISGSSATITGLPSTGANMTYTIRVFNGANDCYDDIQITIPYKDCNINCTVNGGDDQLICQPSTTVDLPDAGANEEWIVGTFNASGTATINTITGVVSGMTTDGTYSFILRDKTNTTCMDEVYVFRGVLELPFITSCTSTYQLPEIAGVTWSSVAGGASITPAGLITGMNTNGHYTFSASFGACTSTIIVEKITCTCTTPNAGADVTICLPKTTLNLADAPSGTQWLAAAGNPATATINATTGVISGLTVIGTYKFVLQNTADITCADTMQVIVTNGEAAIPLCRDGSTSYTLIAPANLTSVIWYNMAGTQVGTGNSLVVNANLAGLADGSEAYYYQGVDGSSSGCDVELCCPVKFITQNCCPVPNCATVTVIKK